MADKFITELPPASNPVDGNTIIIEQGEGTKQLNISELFVKEFAAKESLTSISSDGTNITYVDEAGNSSVISNADIKALYESNPNAFTDADHTKLDGIEAGATADQTGSEIKALYEGEANTNAFTDSYKDTLDDIQASDTFQSIAELKTFSGPVDNYNVNISGYYEAGDGGGGTFYWDASSTEADNGGTIIQATGVTTGRWKRVYSGAVNVRWFGAKGDGTTNDQPAIQAAIDYSRNVYLSDGQYYIASALTISTGQHIVGRSWNTVSLKATSDISVISLSATSDKHTSLLIRGIKMSYQSGTPSTKAAIDFSAAIGGVGYSTIEECSLETFAYGFHTTSALFLSTFKNVNISGFSLSGISLTGGADVGNRFLTCYARSANYTNYAFSFGPASSVLLDNCLWDSASTSNSIIGNGGFYFNGVKTVSMRECKWESYSNQEVDWIGDSEGASVIRIVHTGNNEPQVSIEGFTVSGLNINVSNTKELNLIRTFGTVALDLQNFDCSVVNVGGADLREAFLQASGSDDVVIYDKTNCRFGDFDNVVRSGFDSSDTVSETTSDASVILDKPVTQLQHSVCAQGITTALTTGTGSKPYISNVDRSIVRQNIDISSQIDIFEIFGSDTSSNVPMTASVVVELMIGDSGYGDGFVINKTEILAGSHAATNNTYFDSSETQISQLQHSNGGTESFACTFPVTITGANRNQFKVSLNVSNLGFLPNTVQYLALSVSLKSVRWAAPLDINWLI